MEVLSLIGSQRLKKRTGKICPIRFATHVTNQGAMPKPVADALAKMSRSIQKIEAKRVLKNRSERSRLASESQPIQDAIDAVLFRCYGLTEEEARYVEKRLVLLC
jgi:hypothetical protein